MAVSEKADKELDRSEALVLELLKIVNSLPGFTPLKGDICDSLYNLRSIIHGLRVPRIMVIGRCKSGKSSLINAICGLKVAEVSDTKPETGKAEWKDYYYNGSDLLQILDTRGLQEADVPRQIDSAKSPYESIMKAVEEKCPDVILVVCKATDVFSASKEDLNICEKISAKIKNKYRRELPIIGVLTKCDELSPPTVSLPTINEKKNRNIQEQVQHFHFFLKEKDNLYVKDVIPTVAYAEYEEGKNGLILSDQDYRWNIDKLVETMIRYTPREIRGSLARMACIKKFQLSVAKTVVTACNILCTFVSANPIPGSSIPVVAVIQTFMVAYIAWLGGSEFSLSTAKEFVATAGIGAGANAGLVGIADIGLKFVPGLGSLISAGAMAVATKGLGDTAIALFLKKT